MLSDENGNAAPGSESAESVQGRSGLTVNDLVSLLDTGVRILEANKDLVTPKLLGEVEALLAEAEALFGKGPVSGEQGNDPSGIPGIARKDLGRLFDMARLFLALERRLVETPLGDRLAAWMRRLRNSPVILRLIATFA